MGCRKLTYYERETTLSEIRKIFTMLKEKPVSHLKKSINYYPFGMLQPGRNYSTTDYRFGFNGMEADDEVKGTKNSYTTQFRQYDPRIGRWLSVDPIESGNESSYTGFGNNPIIFIDAKGDSTIYYNKNGEVVFASSDQLDNAIVILSDDLLESFYAYLSYVRAHNGDNDDTQNELLRSYGIKYTIDPFWSFLESTLADINKDKNSKFKGLPNENGVFLYVENGSVYMSGQIVSGSPDNVDVPLPPNGSIGWGHTHPNAGVSISFKDGTSGQFERGVSIIDRMSYFSNNSFFDVVIEEDNLIFINSVDSKEFIIDKNTFKKEVLKQQSKN